MAFLFIVLVAMYVARKVGWSLSRSLLYQANFFGALILLLVWGCAIALGLRLLIDALQPTLILKVIAFGAASYVSIPNYGLIAQESALEYAPARHSAISTFGLLAFIAASILLAYPIEPPRAIEVHRTSPITPTVEDLGRLAKRKYPGSYDDLSDAELGRLVKKKYPGLYDGFVGVPQNQTPSATASLNANEIQPQPSRVSRLNERQLTRVRIIQRALAEVDDSSLKKWTEDFEKDSNPEQEISTGESIVDAYQRYCSTRQLGGDAKRDVFKLLLVRSWTDDEMEVLRGTKLSTLTRDEAIEAMRLFKGPATPIEIEKK